MGGQIGGYAYIYKYEAIYESYFMVAEMSKSTLKTHIHKTAKSKPTSNKLKEEVCFILKIHYQSKRLINKVFLVKQ